MLVQGEVAAEITCESALGKQEAPPAVCGLPAASGQPGSSQAGAF